MMKRIFILLLALRGVAFAQCDPPTSSAVTAISGNAVQVTFVEAAGAVSVNWYIYKMPARTLVSSGISFANLFNVTASGLTPGGTYRFIISSNCPGPATSVADSLIFSIPATAITYTPMSAAGYQYKRVQVDSTFSLPFVDTALYNGINRPGAMICNTGDSVIYSWTGRYWSPFIIGGSSLVSITKVRYPLQVLYMLDTGAPTDSLIIAQSWIDSAISGGGGGGTYGLDSMYISSDSLYQIFIYDSGRRDSVAFYGGSSSTGSVEYLTQGYGTLLDSSGRRYTVRVDTTVIQSKVGNATLLGLKLNITDTANMRIRPIAGTNMTITGTFPNLTFNATGGAGGGAADSTLFWPLTGKYVAGFGKFVGNRDRYSLYLKTNDSTRLYIDSVNYRVGIGLTNPVYNLDAVDAIRAGGTSGIAYWVGNNSAIRNNATTNGAMYIDAARDLTGTISIRGTTVNINGATVGNSTSVWTAVNVSLGTSAYSVSGISLLNIKTDSTMVRYNDNSTIRANAFRGANNIFNDDNTQSVAAWQVAPNALLELRSTTKAFLPPRMTKTQRDAIVLTGVGIGTIVGGSGYTNLNYASVSLTGGTGTGATAKINIQAGNVNSVTILNVGSGYTLGDVLSATLAGGSGFTYTLTQLSGTPGMTIFQTDNTPGQRVWNGTNWMKYTETAD